MLSESKHSPFGEEEIEVTARFSQEEISVDDFITAVEKFKSDNPTLKGVITIHAENEYKDNCLDKTYLVLTGTRPLTDHEQEERLREETEWGERLRKAEYGLYLKLRTQFEKGEFADYCEHLPDEKP